MNRADVISMARKSGAVFDQRYIGEVAFISKDALERFAALVAEAITPDFQDAWMNGEKGFVT